jgi:hypothetical protein
MSAQILKGHTFHDGDTAVSAATLNSFVDSATILPGVITEQAATLPTFTDSFLFAGANGLKQCTAENILGLIPINAGASTASLRELGILGNQAAAGNDTRFPAQITGLRKGNGVGADTAAVPKDTLFPPVVLTANQTIDWDAADVFTRDMAASETFPMINFRVGRTITIIFKLNGHAAVLTSSPSPRITTLGTGINYWYITLTTSALGIMGNGTLIT